MDDILGRRLRFERQIYAVLTLDLDSNVYTYTDQKYQLPRFL